MTAELAAPALLVFSYLSPDRPRAGAGWATLVDLWGRARAHLHLDRPIPGLHVPADLPPVVPARTSESMLMAAAESGGPGIRQALARLEHDVACLVVMNAPEETTARGERGQPSWVTLEADWRRVASDRAGDGVLGETRIFLGLYPPGTPEQAVVGLARAALPPPVPVGWWRSPTRFGGGVTDVVTSNEVADGVAGDGAGDGASGEVLLWEVSVPPDDGRALRRLVLLGPTDRELDIDDLVWTASGDGKLAPLAHFLLHAAKLHYQMRVFAGGQSLRALRDRLDSLVDQAHAIAHRPGGTGPGLNAPARDVPDAPAGRDLAARLAAELAVARTVLSRLRHMRHTTMIIESNLRLFHPLPGAGGPIDDDLRLAGWLSQRLDDEVWTMQEAHDRAAAVAEHATAHPLPTAPVPTTAADGRAGPGPAPTGDPATATATGAPTHRGTGTRHGSPTHGAAADLWQSASVPDAPDAPVAGGNASADPAAHIDVVIITALPVEEAAMVTAIGTCSIHRWRGRDLHVGEVGGLRVLVFPLGGMGNVGAAQAAERVVGIWSPALLLLVGIAGGARGGVDDLRLGDVLVPDQVVGYELAKVTPDATVPRYQVYRPHPDLLAAARSVSPSEWALALVTPRPDGETGRIIPRAHFGPVLSGEKVLAENQVVENLRSAWPKAIGVEMESLGAALAAYRGGPGFLTVRAASDFADAEKNDGWHPYAAEAAARFAVAVLQRSSVRPDRPGRRPQAVRMDAPRTFPGRSKVYVCNRLHDSWDDVADMFDVPAYHKARFRAGNQPRDLWEWLEARDKLYELPAVLDEVGRGDLADMLRSGSP